MGWGNRASISYAERKKWAKRLADLQAENALLAQLNGQLLAQAYHPNACGVWRQQGCTYGQGILLSNSPPLPLSEDEALRRYKDATAGYYDSVPEGYHVVEDSDGERLVPNPQPPTPYVRAAVGDRVRCTLEGVLTSYSDDGIWTLRGSSIEGHVEWEYQLHWGTTFTPVSVTPEAATETCEHGQTEWHEVVVTPLYEHRICPGPPTSTPEAATDGDEKLTQLKLTQMRAAVVQCCNAGREAYPDPCPWHGPKGQQS